MESRFAKMLKTVTFLPVTKLLSSEQIESLADSNELTWPVCSSNEGHALVPYDALLEEMCELGMISYEEAEKEWSGLVPDGTLIDLQH